MHQAALLALPKSAQNVCLSTLLCTCVSRTQDGLHEEDNSHTQKDEWELATIQWRAERKSEGMAPLWSAPQHHRNILSTRVLNDIKRIKLISAKCKVNQHIHQAVMSLSALVSHTTFRQKLQNIAQAQRNTHSTRYSCYLLHVGTHITLGLLFELGQSGRKQKHMQHTVKTNLTVNSNKTVDTLQLTC